MIRNEQASSPSLDGDLLPVRMCNEFVYCPRLFYLMHVQGLFAHSADTVVGARQHDARKHRKTKGGGGHNGEDETDNSLEPISRSETLTADQWGVRGKMDLLEVESEGLVVVEYKKGGSPSFKDHKWENHHLPYGAWPGDLAQVGLYMAILREHGMACSRARIFYRKDRRNVQIDWSESLELFLKDVVHRARETSRRTSPPLPLIDSPKCPKCSLVEICLPLEHVYLHRSNHSLEDPSDSDSDENPEAATIPRLIPGSDDLASVHVISAGSTIRKRGENVLVEKRDGGRQTVLGKDIGHLAIYGPSQITHQCLLYLSENGVCVTHHTGAGRLLGLTTPLNTKNIALRRAQFRAADCDAKTLILARSLTRAKISNQRTLLRRYRASIKSSEKPTFWETEKELEENRKAKLDLCEALSETLKRLSSCARRVKFAENLGQVRGFEGDAAAQYFRSIPQIVPPAWRLEFQGRSRRPPRDKINALLSFGYSLLVKDAINAIVGVGLDPMLGFLHTMIPGRPALALDLMEPFRAAWVDVAVFRLIATGGIQLSDFTSSSMGVYLSDAGRRSLIGAYERRADEETTHPYFGYKMSIRRLLALDCRLMAKYMAEEVSVFSPFTTR